MVQHAAKRDNINKSGASHLGSPLKQLFKFIIYLNLCIYYLNLNNYLNLKHAAKRNNINKSGASRLGSPLKQLSAKHKLPSSNSL